MSSLDEARKIINEIDREMAKLFVRRMRASETVSAYKKEHGLRIRDAEREAEVIRRNASSVEDKTLREYYVRFLSETMALSRAYQERLMSGMRTLRVNLGERSYDITVGKGLLTSADEYFNLHRRVFILTDDGVPKEYAEAVLSRAKEGIIYTVPAGEGSKSMATLEAVLVKMMESGMTRGDALVAVGGGVVGDLGGFAAATYMRGIDFYGVPTTVLSAVDSSVGGKCAVNLGSTKNVVGAFHQPKAVLIDVDTFKTLDKRLVSEGLAEAVKMALCMDAELFKTLEAGGVTDENTENVIIRSLMIKKAVVEADERESGLRKVLNFGHTLGHGIEAVTKTLYHGECVALGMIPMCVGDVRERLVTVLKRLELPTEYGYDLDGALSFVKNDKKCKGGAVDVIEVGEVGSYEIKQMEIDEFTKMIKERAAKK